MKTTIRRLTVLGATLAATASIAATATASPQRPLGAQLAEVRAATVQYHDVDVAIAAGYTPDPMCVGDEDQAMGHHFVNFDLVFDGVVDATQPEVLLYAPAPNGDYRLVGVEYLSLTPASLFGHELEPAFGGLAYALHAWVWQANPAGVFVGNNTSLSC